MTSHVIEYRPKELLFGTHACNLYCFLDDFNCIYTLICTAESGSSVLPVTGFQNENNFDCPLLLLKIIMTLHMRVK